MKHENLTKEFLGRHITPCGYRVLVMPAPVPEKTKGGLILTESTRQINYQEATFGKVIALGKECYLNKEAFPLGAHVAVGDWCDFTGIERVPKRLIYRNNDGTTFEKLLFYVNDNRFLGVMDNPDDILNEVNSKFGAFFSSIKEIEDYMKKRD
jgi:co-chaperonin GroES (HSP10)